MRTMFATTTIKIVGAVLITAFAALAAGCAQPPAPTAPAVPVTPPNTDVPTQ